MKIPFTSFLYGAPLLLALSSLAACEQGDKCKAKPDCAKLGKCTADPNGICVIASNDDCKGAELCKLHGKCSAQKNACVAATDADCKGTDDCAKLGMCSAYQGLCTDLAKSVHAECSKTCETEGLCVTAFGKCAALSRLHCAGTVDEKPEKESPCAKNGLCTAKDGACAAGSR